MAMRLFFCLLMLMLSGCDSFLIRKLQIEQGNVYDQKTVSQLRIGMSEAQVKEIMGIPVLVTLFTPDRLQYVYTFQKGHQKRFEKRVTCIFEHGRLQAIQQSL